MKKIVHIMIVISIVLMFAFMIISIFAPELLLPIVEWIKKQIELIGKWNYLLSFLSALFESLPVIGSIIPGQVIIMSVGGFYGGLGIEQFIGVLLAGILGSVLSNWIGYILGKKYGESFFDTYGMWVGIQNTEINYMKKGVNTWGPWGIIGAKFHPHFRAFLPFMAGSMGLTLKKFWIFNTIASILWASTFIIIGIFFAEYYEIIIQYIRYLLLFFILIFILYIWRFKKKEFMQYMYEKNKEVEAKMNNKG